MGFTEQCSCKDCGQVVTFGPEQAGEPGSCPGCGSPIWYVSTPKKPLGPQTVDPVYQPKAERLFNKGDWSFDTGVAFQVVLSFVALVLLANGFFSEAKSVMHQIYCAIQYCTGFILIGIVLLCGRVDRLK